MIFKKTLMLILLSSCVTSSLLKNRYKDEADILINTELDYKKRILYDGSFSILKTQSILSDSISSVLYYDTIINNVSSFTYLYNIKRNKIVKILQSND